MASAADCLRGECLWFEQGCTIGCECTQDPNNPSCADPMAPINVDDALSGYPGYQKYFYSTPWRAPGYARISDSCGLSGGGKFYHPENGGSPAPGYKQGFPGSKLDPTEPTLWKAGGVAEVAWSIKANHGGGYSYRIAPLNSSLDEETFAKHPLTFAEPSVSYIQYGTNESNRSAIKSVTTQLTKGNATWKKNPIPGCTYHEYSAVINSPADGKLHGGLGVGNKGKDGTYECKSPLFEPPLPGLFGFGDSVCGSHVFDFYCTEEEKRYQREHFEFSIIDKVVVPETKGRFVLSFRWDCEQTPQVWTSCADIEIV